MMGLHVRRSADLGIEHAEIVGHDGRKLIIHPVLALPLENCHRIPRPKDARVRAALEAQIPTQLFKRLI